MLGKLTISKESKLKNLLQIILPIFMGVEGVLWAGPVSDVLDFLTAIVVLFMYWKKIFTKKIV